ncbi:MAG: hypothetical protein RL217_1102 [Pseudomonadota bacterium]|jgi:DNA-binding response OmpR family regulator
MNILLVDDDQELCALLKRYLERELFQVEVVHDAEAGLKEALSGKYQAVILDIMLPGGNGLDILRTLRSRSHVPVLMLTAKGDEMDRIDGLEIGADDYLAKPCNPRELSARLRSILRRGRPIEVASEQMQIDDLTIDFGQHQVFRNAKSLDLTLTEFNILSTLAREPGKIIEKNNLAEQSLQRSLTLFDRSLDMHLSNLRKKLGTNNKGEPRIRTVRGLGYMYATEDTP